MKREDIDVMDAKARAKLEENPRYAALRYTVQAYPYDLNEGCAICAEAGFSVIVSHAENVSEAIVSGIASQATAEHIAASDPHAVLALIAELRRVEQERDALLDQRFLWLGRVLFPQLLDMPDDIILGRAPSGMSDAERAEMADFRKRVEESPERIFREVMRGERVPYNDAGSDLLQKAVKDGAPPTDGFAVDAPDKEKS